MPRALDIYQLWHETTGREIPARFQSNASHINIAIAATFDVGNESVTVAMWPCFHRLIAKHKAQKEALLARFA